MSRGKRLRRATATADLTERKLTNGWAGAPGVRVRQATPAGLLAVVELAPLAGVGLEDTPAGAVCDGSSGAALQADIRHGLPGFQRHMATQFAAGGDMVDAYLHASPSAGGRPSRSANRRRPDGLPARQSHRRVPPQRPAPSPRRRGNA